MYQWSVFGPKKKKILKTSKGDLLAFFIFFLEMDNETDEETDDEETNPQLQTGMLNTIYWIRES